MTREEIIARFTRKKLFVIIRDVYGQECLRLAKALADGGIELAEVTFDPSDAEKRKKTVQTIRLLRDSLGERMSVGAGTVTTAEMLFAAKNAGAEFIVSPNTDAQLIRMTADSDLISVPGAMTPTEISLAYQSGADFVKVFPASCLGTDYFKLLHTPLRQIPLWAVGGIRGENLGAFLAAGAAGAGVGEYLADKRLIAEGAFGEITKRAERLTAAVAADRLCNAF